jgi:glucose dehydrogenase/cytochrome c5
MVRRGGLVCLLGLLALVVLISGCGGGGGSTGSESTEASTSEAPAESTEPAESEEGSTGTASAAGGLELSETWSAPNANAWSTREVGGPIEASNVKELGTAWRVPIQGVGLFGDWATTPVVNEGVVYAQDMASNVYAIELETGKLKWVKKYEEKSMGPTGVNVSEGMVFGATEEFAFALNAETGEQMWQKKLTRNKNEGIDMAPGIDHETIYISTTPCRGAGCYEGNQRAVLWALEPKTGKTKWKWNEVPANLWGNPKINSGGGQWQAPTFDEEGNLYVGVANPGPLANLENSKAWGQTRPGPNLYTDSIVKLNHETGKVEWHYQLIPHDVWDWDINNTPALTEVEVNGEQVIVGAGKAGIAFGLSAKTGKPLWKTPLGKRTSKLVDEANVLAENGEYDKLNKLKEEENWIFPGIWGGVETQFAVAGGTMFLANNNLGIKYGKKEPGIEIESIEQGYGEMVAIDIETGKVEWTHKFEHSPYGGASVTNNLVFTTTLDGIVWALNTETGKVEWQSKLPAGTNAPVAINEDMVITAGSYPQGKGQVAEIVAFKLGATGPEPAPGTSETKGNGDEGNNGPASVDGAEGTSEEGAEGEAAGASASGKEVFSTICAACHTLAAAGAEGTTGPNLDELKPSKALTEKQVTNGGGGMPAFGGELSKEEIAAVAEYVEKEAGKR